MSSHSHMKGKNITSVPGTGHLLMAEMDWPGVELAKSLGGGLTGLTAERDATFQVGNNLTTIITICIFLAEWHGVENITWPYYFKFNWYFGRPTVVCLVGGPHSVQLGIFLCPWHNTRLCQFFQAALT